MKKLFIHLYLIFLSFVLAYLSTIVLFRWQDYLVYTCSYAEFAIPFFIIFIIVFEAIYYRVRQHKTKTQSNNSADESSSSFFTDVATFAFIMHLLDSDKDNDDHDIDSTSHNWTDADDWNCGDTSDDGMSGFDFYDDNDF